MHMTTSQAKTLQIFLPTGEPRGIRIAEIPTRIVQAVLIPRSELTEAKKRKELDHVAVYMLFGELEEAAKPLVYIGQTEDPRRATRPPQQQQGVLANGGFSGFPGPRASLRATFNTLSGCASRKPKKSAGFPSTMTNLSANRS